MRSTDSGGLCVDRTFIISVVDLDEAPASASSPTGPSGKAAAPARWPSPSAIRRPRRSLTVTASSNDQLRIPDAGLVLGGSGANRTITVTPAAGCLRRPGDGYAERVGRGEHHAARVSLVSIDPIADHLVVVDTASDLADGDTSSIDALLMNRGADGYISLREAILAANGSPNSGGPDRIHFNIAGGRPAHDQRTVGAAGDHRCGGSRRDHPAGLCRRAADRAERGRGGRRGGRAHRPRGRQHRARPGDQPFRRLRDLCRRQRRQPDPGQLHRPRRGGQCRPGQWHVRHLGDHRFQSGRRNRGRATATSSPATTSTASTSTAPATTWCRATTSAPTPPLPARSATAEDGIWLHNASSNVIGGTAPGARNILSGNNWSGIGLSGGGADNVIQGNYIGVDASGSAGLPNLIHGIDVAGASDTLIGGTAAGAENIIAFNLAGRGSDHFGNGALGSGQLDLQPMTGSASTSTTTG